MNPFEWVEKLISEHGSSAALRDHLALVKEQKAQLNAQTIILNAKIKKLEEENAILQTKISELQIDLQDANNEIKTLQYIKGALHGENALKTQIANLQFRNQELERMLRIRSIGF